jgi:hypothetical protein
MDCNGTRQAAPSPHRQLPDVCLLHGRSSGEVNLVSYLGTRKQPGLMSGLLAKRRITSASTRASSSVIEVDSPPRHCPD